MKGHGPALGQGHEEAEGRAGRVDPTRPDNSMHRLERRFRLIHQNAASEWTGTTPPLMRPVKAGRAGREIGGNVTRRARYVEGSGGTPAPKLNPLSRLLLFSLRPCRFLAC
jgi:hypothetical protein